MHGILISATYELCPFVAFVPSFFCGFCGFVAWDFLNISSALLFSTQQCDGTLLLRASDTVGTVVFLLECGHTIGYGITSGSVELRPFSMASPQLLLERGHTVWRRLNYVSDSST